MTCTAMLHIFLNEYRICLKMKKMEVSQSNNINFSNETHKNKLIYVNLIKYALYKVVHN